MYVQSFICQWRIESPEGKALIAVILKLCQGSNSFPDMRKESVYITHPVFVEMYCPAVTSPAVVSSGSDLEVLMHHSSGQAILVPWLHFVKLREP